MCNQTHRQEDKSKSTNKSYETWIYIPCLWSQLNYFPFAQETKIFQNLQIRGFKWLIANYYQALVIMCTFENKQISSIQFKFNQRRQLRTKFPRLLRRHSFVLHRFYSTLCLWCSFQKILIILVNSVIHAPDKSNVNATSQFTVSLFSVTTICSTLCTLHLLFLCQTLTLCSGFSSVEEEALDISQVGE